MYLASLTYCSVNGGPFSGVFTITAELSNKGAQLSSADVIDKIMTFAGTKRPPIRIHGELSATTSEEMFGFCQTLKDFGFKLSLLCDGQSRTNWMSLIDWLIVLIGPGHWLRFHCHELRYLLKKGEEAEPELPQVVPSIYVVPSTDITNEDLFRFLKKAKHQWGIILPASKLYSTKIWRSTK